MPDEDENVRGSLEFRWPQVKTIYPGECQIFASPPLAEIPWQARQFRFTHAGLCHVRRRVKY